MLLSVEYISKVSKVERKLKCFLCDGKVIVVKIKGSILLPPFV